VQSTRPDWATAPETVRDRICWATIAVIADDGVDGVRHRKVAEVAGVSLGSTTYHFSDRGELVREAFRWYLEHAGDAIERLRPDHLDPVRVVVDHLAGLVNAEGDELGILRAEYELLLLAAKDVELRSDVQQWERRQRSRLAGDLAAAGCAEPRRSATTLIALVRGLEMEVLLHGPIPMRQLRARIEPVVRAQCSA
jgi:TetR/AcrR family transcriptional regulator, regulator of biofilm formation and stress response